VTGVGFSDRRPQQGAPKAWRVFALRSGATAIDAGAAQAPCLPRPISLYAVA